MAEIPSEKSIKSDRHRIEQEEVKELIDYSDVKSLIEYQYAKNFLDHPQHAEGLRRSLTKMIESNYKTLDSQSSFPSYLIADSQETSAAWDALCLIVPVWLRADKPLPLEAARWKRRRAGGPKGEAGAEETAAPTGPG